MEDELEIWHTPFGVLHTHKVALVERMKNQLLIFEIISRTEMIDNGEPDGALGYLVWLEKVKDKFPNEPFLHYQIAECYKGLNEHEIYKDKVEDNYASYRGYPPVDIAFVSSLGENEQQDMIPKVFGASLNLHEIYPKYKAFTAEEVEDFYSLHCLIRKRQKDFSTARQCTEVLAIIGEVAQARKLYMQIDLDEKTWKRWGVLLILILIILFLLSLVGGVIWGLVRLVQWIF